MYTDAEAEMFQTRIDRLYSGQMRQTKEEVFREVGIDRARLADHSIVEIPNKYAFERYRISRSYGLGLWLVSGPKDLTRYDSDQHLVYGVRVVPWGQRAEGKRADHK
jgi:hypothetical protein